ncbi:unnamed protein product [Arctia plantaginis]|uniref:Uncharacterized protein n=1 Tax=Arctia plantaginis TaxID=874455 RepID=A0A8S1AME6_ARCPL|nr:unnamed protein product [Arctia plantaginis]CAB3249042.1 unnamed protein product [Arctia plantaginis]
MTLNREEEAPTNDALTAKIITMVCLFSISMVVGCLPFLLSLKFNWFKSDGNLRNSNKVVMGLLSFGGGVLFATTFMHLLPEVDENIELLQESGEFPEGHIFFAGIIMCSGFFMMYLIEELVHLYINNRAKKKTDSNFIKPFHVRKDSTAVAEPEAKENDVENHTHKGHCHSAVVKGEDGEQSALRGLLIVLALSIHELFEGLAVGLESSVANVWYMFGAVSAHKYIIGFCIGVELVAAGTKRWLSIVYVFTYSFMSALGIAIGILMVGGAGAAEAGIYSVILQGIACGTLMYVVFFEVWKNNSGLLEFTCGFIGFVVMVLISFTIETVLDL